MSNRKKISIGQIEALGNEGDVLTILSGELAWSSYINLLVRFIDVEPFEISSTSNFKITSIVSGTGVTASLKLSDGVTNYTLGDTVAANDYLILSVDVVGNVKIKGYEI